MTIRNRDFCHSVLNRSVNPFRRGCYPLPPPPLEANPKTANAPPCASQREEETPESQPRHVSLMCHSKSAPAALALSKLDAQCIFIFEEPRRSERTTKQQSRLEPSSRGRSEGCDQPEREAQYRGFPGFRFLFQVEESLPGRR